MDEHRSLLAEIIGGGVMRRRALIEAMANAGIEFRLARDSIIAFEESGILEPLWVGSNPLVRMAA